jgi:hypothetical protein
MNNTLKYKLIKCYPNSPKLDTIIERNLIAGIENNWYIVEGNNKYFFTDLLAPEHYSEFWEKIEEKNWVITGGKVHAAGYSLITQVTRLPDYTKFEIGDKVHNPKCLSQKFTIERFYLDCNNIHMLAGPGHIGIHKIEHYKEPLFVTEDFVEICPGDTYWCVNNAPHLWSCFAQTAKDRTQLNKTVKAFSTLDLALKYIKDNKPTFTKKELLDIINLDGDDYTDGEALDKLLELIESK